MTNGDVRTLLSLLSLLLFKRRMMWLVHVPELKDIKKSRLQKRRIFIEYEGRSMWSREYVISIAYICTLFLFSLIIKQSELYAENSSDSNLCYLLFHYFAI